MHILIINTATLNNKSHRMAGMPCAGGSQVKSRLIT